MRTKTLVFAAAVAAAGMSMALAQPVYSVNVVGYVQVTLKPGFNAVANPLNAGEGNNVIDKLFADVPDGSAVYTYTPGTGFSIVTRDFGAWDRLGVSLAPGTGFFFRNTSGADLKVTFVGEVIQGSGLTINLANGFNLVGSLVPQAGKLSTDLKYVAEDGETVYEYDPATGYSSTVFDFGEWAPAEPTIDVAQGFWIRTTKAKSWVRDFTVAP